MEFGTGNARYVFGTGYVILPEGINREEYVLNCYNKEQFSIITNDGEFVADVMATKQIIDDIIIPEEPKILGTQVLFMNIYKQNKPIIFATISKKGISVFKAENDFGSSKSFEGGAVGNVANTKSLTFTSFIKSYFDKAVSYIIQVAGNKKSKFQVESSGWIILQFEEGIKIKNKKKELIINGDKIIYTDDFDNKVVIDKDKMMLKNVDKKIRLMLDKDGYNLGTINFYKYFSKMWQYMLTKLQVQTAFGPSGFITGTPIGQPELEKLIQEFDKIDKWEDNIH